LSDRIVLVPHGAGNIGSLMELFHAIGRFPHLASSPDELTDAALAVVPGVGASGSAMQRLHETGFADALVRMNERQQRILGICVGAQIMFEDLHEDHCTGLGLLSGNVSRIAHDDFNNGWSGVRVTSADAAHKPMLLRTAQKNFYFNHGYQINTEVVMEERGETSCDKHLLAYVLRDNLCGIQFHPEKSQATGVAFIGQVLKHYGL
jgi:glutamine amidotransferase